MERFKGFVVIKDGQFYVNEKRFTDDLGKAKDFNSKGTARKVAEKVGGEVRELNYAPEQAERERRQRQA